jgi:hypothetical protein
LNNTHVIYAFDVLCKKVDFNSFDTYFFSESSFSHSPFTTMAEKPTRKSDHVFPGYEHAVKSTQQFLEDLQENNIPPLSEVELKMLAVDWGLIKEDSTGIIT